MSFKHTRMYTAKYLLLTLAKQWVFMLILGHWNWKIAKDF